MKLKNELSRGGFVTNYPHCRTWKKEDIDSILTSKPINIYIHVPYCTQRCAYCYYLTKTGRSRSEINNYVDALCREIDLASRHFYLKEREVISIYFGGGTPTLLTEENFIKIAETLRKNFKIENPEFTVEAEPVTLTDKKAKVLKDLNINRISVGVQSLNNDILKLCKRHDTEKKALKAIDIARSAVDVVNMDLLSGLAGETLDTWAYTIEKAIATEVESITVYKMELYSNTDYFKDIRNKKIELPSDDQEIEFIKYAIDQFDRTQYMPWSFFTFTKNGLYEHVYITSIWRGNDCYSFGPSAFGSISNRLFQNTGDIDNYLEVINNGRLPLNRGYYLTSLDQMIRNILLEMKLIRMDLKNFQNKYGFKLQTLCSSSLNQLETDGFISISETEIKMTKKGILYGDYVGKVLANNIIDSYMEIE